MTGRPRTFDHDEARRLRDDENLSYPEIGRRLGVHHTSVMYACNVAFRVSKKKAAREDARWRREHRAAA